MKRSKLPIGVYLLGTALVLVPITGWIGQNAVLWLALSLVAIGGLPHGAMDLPLGRRVFGGHPRRAWLPVFGFAYAGLAAATAALWLAFPAAGLAGFLLLAAWHFGHEDARAYGIEKRPVASAGLGLLPVALPLALATDNVHMIFEQLLFEDGAWLTPSVVLGAGAVGSALGIGALAALLLSPAKPSSEQVPRLRMAVDYASLAILYAVLPALLAFALYFVFVHAARHQRSLGVVLFRGSAGETRVSRRLTVAATAGPVALGVSLFVAGGLGNNAVLPAGHMATAIVFVGLAALTVPHMLFNDFILRRIYPPPRPSGQAGDAPFDLPGPNSRLLP